MSSRGELFIVEEVIPLVEDEINAITDDWYPSIPNLWYDLWDDADFPDKGEIPILNENAEQIGTVTFEVEFKIEKDHGSRYIVAYPKNVKFLKEE